jgi:hypothetical protein
MDKYIGKLGLEQYSVIEMLPPEIAKDVVKPEALDNWWNITQSAEIVRVRDKVAQKLRQRNIPGFMGVGIFGSALSKMYLREAFGIQPRVNGVDLGAVFDSTDWSDPQNPILNHIDVPPFDQIMTRNTESPEYHNRVVNAGYDGLKPFYAYAVKEVAKEYRNKNPVAPDSVQYAPTELSMENVFGDLSVSANVSLMHPGFDTERRKYLNDYIVMLTTGNSEITQQAVIVLHATVEQGNPIRIARNAKPMSLNQLFEDIFFEILNPKMNHVYPDVRTVTDLSRLEKFGELARKRAIELSRALLESYKDYIG